MLFRRFELKDEFEGLLKRRKVMSFIFHPGLFTKATLKRSDGLTGRLRLGIHLGSES